jgi:hypothetical protein
MNNGSISSPPGAMKDDVSEEYVYLMGTPPISNRASMPLYSTSHDYHEQFYKKKTQQPQQQRIIQLPGPEKQPPKLSYPWRIIVGVLSLTLLAESLGWVAFSVYLLHQLSDPPFHLHCILTISKSSFLCVACIIGTISCLSRSFALAITYLVSLLATICWDVGLLISYLVILKNKGFEFGWADITNITEYSSELLFLICITGLVIPMAVTIRRENKT